MRVGQVPFVTVDLLRQHASLWTLDPERPLPQSPDADNAPPTWGARARAAWDDAMLAVTRAVPYLWSAVPDVANPPPAHHVVTLHWRVAEGEYRWSPASPATTLTGRSFGGAFLWSIASCAIGLPVRADTIASVQISADANTNHVRGIDIKTAFVAHVAPSIRHFFVASTQDDAPEGTQSAAKAKALVDHMWTDAELTARLRELAATPARGPIIDNLAFLARSGRGAAADWTPVAQAAQLLAATEGPSGAAGTGWQLAMIESVALRHMGRQAALTLPPDDWFAGQPAPTQVQLAAQLIQHAADTGTPDPAAVRRWMDSFPAIVGWDPQQTEHHDGWSVPTAAASFDDHLKLRGALARLLSFHGRFEAALAIQRDCARAWVARNALDQFTYPLSEWLRLAGVLRDTRSWQEASALFRQAQTLGRIPAAGRSYVEFETARAAIMLGEREGVPPWQEIAARLERMANAPHFHLHLRLSAWRWLAVADPARRHESAGALRARAEQGAAKTAALYTCLMELDHGVGDGRVEALLAARPSPTRHLIAAHGKLADADLAAWLARAFPY